MIVPLNHEQRHVERGRSRSGVKRTSERLSLLDRDALRRLGLNSDGPGSLPVAMPYGVLERPVVRTNTDGGNGDGFEHVVGREDADVSDTRRHEGAR